MKGFLYFVFLISVSQIPVYGQSSRMFKGLEASSSISQSYGDTVITFHVKPADDDMQHVEDRRYYWFHQGYVKSTVGYHSGKLLHGKTERFNRKGSLLEAGEFQEGLKTGVWRTWYENGNLASKHVWKNGVLKGEFTFYYNNGTIQQRGQYKAGKIHGKVFIYNEQGKIQVKERYVKGKLVVKRSKSKDKKLQPSNTKVTAQSQPVPPEGDAVESKTKKKKWYQFWRKKDGAIQETKQKSKQKSTGTSAENVSADEESLPTAKPSKKKKKSTTLPE